MTITLSTRAPLAVAPPSVSKAGLAAVPSTGADPVADTQTHLATSRLSPTDKASFAVTSRLLASFVTEALLTAIYVPVDSEQFSGLCLILSSATSKDTPISALKPADIYAVLPLHHEPILKGRATPYGTPVWLLDPLDMLPAVYDVAVDGFSTDPSHNVLDAAVSSTLRAAPWNLHASAAFTRTLDHRHWWNKFADDVSMTSDLKDTLIEEISSSYIWQKAVYDNVPSCPTLDSPPIQWEQCLVEGHPTHPMHRARRTLPPLAAVNPKTRDWYRPKIRFAVVSRERLEILGPFEEHVRALAQTAAAKAGKTLPNLQDTHVIMPLYDLQVANVQAKFEDVQILDEDISLDALGQASLRTVTLRETPMALKLAVGIKVSSALRTISHFTANIGPRFSADIVPKLAVDPAILHIERETSSAVCTRDPAGAQIDADVAKHFTAVFREQFTPKSDEAVILCAALAESGHPDVPAGVPVIQHILGLDTVQKRTSFLDQYARLLIAAVVPPMLHNGLAFEAHPQNTLVRISRTTRTVTGFVMRDLGGLRVHPPTLRASTGVPFEFLPDHCVVTETVQEASKKLYHTLVFNHLQRLTRALGLHYNGVGWEIVRGHLETQVPRDSWLWKVWMDEGAMSVSGKCLVRMKLAGLYRDSVYEPFPNLIQFRAGQGVGSPVEETL
ncbi:IucC family-domain-containing protein [Amylostereum chailletii]|nr:IucC family-domain-containing protein [Amylostereum chailletii]